MLEFKFGCASNAEAFVASPHQFSHFQAGALDTSLLSFLEIGADGSVNISRLAVTPHRATGANGLVDITARAHRIVFSGTSKAGAKMSVDAGKVKTDQEGRIARIVPMVDQTSFFGTRAVEPKQEVTCVTERCV